MTLSFEDANVGATLLYSYQVCNLATFICQTVIPQGFHYINVTFDNLSPTSLYEFEIVAKNSYNTSSATKVLGFTGEKPPMNVQVTNVGVDFAQLAWQSSDLVMATAIKYIELMKLCWSTNPNSRPSFEQVIGVFDSHPEAKIK